MSKKRQQIDGFIPRRPHEQGVNRREIGQGRLAKDTMDAKPKPEEQKSTISTDEKVHRPEAGRIRSEIDQSLKAIEQDEPVEKAPRRRFFRHKPKKVQSRRRKIIKRTIIVIALIILGLLGFIAYKAISSSDSLFQGNVLGLLKGQPLKEDSNGRSNVLILGTTDDDPDHPGNDLTDTMMILSVDQNRHNAYMISIPRDLYVDYGRSCDAGMSGKINAYFPCINDGSTDEKEQARLKEAQDFIGEIFGMDIQYGTHVNSVVVRDLVDAVGGIDVEIKGSDGAPGILDRNFDWGCDYKCYKVKYDNGTHHLDGEQAMFLAMARGNTEPTYGLGNSNFDREQNQQKIIKALQKKSLSAGTFTNFGRVTKILDGFGNNLRTNFKTSEVRTLVHLARHIDTKKIDSIHLQDKKEKLFDTPTIPGVGSVVSPAAGTFDFSELQAFLKKRLSSNPVVREGASVAIYNASDTPGAAEEAARKLRSKGFTISATETAPEGTPNKTALYRTTSKYSQTRKKLESRYNVEASKSQPPFVVPDSTDFILIINGS